MKTTKELKEQLKAGEHDGLLMDIYLDEAKLDYQRQRYIDAVDKFEELYQGGAAYIYSAPGRSEIGGNHTDHQNGEVLAASVNLDAIAVVRPVEEPVVTVVSGDFPMVKVALDDLAHKEEEDGTTLSLVKGVVAEIKNRGYQVGGFEAYITSDVLIGAGLSSSAAFETIIGTILSGIYNEMKISPVEIAVIGQYAENVYFGKPCGLMDQTASSVGNLVHIDFADKTNPVIEVVSCNLAEYGYSLCITDTKGSHEDLTPDYAAVPAEMRAAAAVFGKEVLHDVTFEDLMAHSAEVREAAGDRAFLRAIHFVQENKRVRAQVKALQEKDFPAFLRKIKESGDSSFKYLQNVYTNHDIGHQNVSIALAVSDAVLGENGVSRVHGGGFAGTIQAFVKNDAVKEYKTAMDTIFGTDACNVLKIRKYGGMRVL